MSSTLADLIANNTSGSSLYSATGSGNATPRNVSQISVKNLLYAGATTKVYVHMQGWFWLTSTGAFNSHLKNVNVHYNDGKAGTGYNATQLGLQLDDMVRRGIDGVILDWYGPAAKTNSPNSDSTAAGLKALCNGKGLEFAICIDQSGLKDVVAHEGGTLTSAFTTCIDYVNATYYGDAAYMKKGGVPVLFFFPPGDTTVYNWTTVRNELLAQGNPIFVSEGKSAYSIVDGSGNRVCKGAFSWVNPGGGITDPEGLNYTADFFNFYAGKGFHLFGSPIKGFNDDLTNGIIGDGIGNWGTGAVRSVGQFNGNTWKDRWGVINSKFNAGNQLENVQLPTWDDYEEGSELETGIASNLVFTSLSIAGTNLSWVVSGNAAVYDHYEVWAASDGINFNLQGTSSTLSYALALGVGSWTLVVKAIGIPFVQNVLSGTVGYSVTPPPPPPPPEGLLVTETTFVKPNIQNPVVEKDGTLGRSLGPWLHKFVGRVKLQLCDTTNGPANQPLPLARNNQNVEILLKKTSADSNALTPIPSVGVDGIPDTIDVATAITAQNGTARYISDGVRGWYLV